MFTDQYLYQIFKASDVPGLLLLPDAPHFTVAGATGAYLKLTHKRDSDLLGKKLIEIFPDNSAIFQSLNKVISGRGIDKIKRSSYGFLNADQATHFFETENVPVFNRKGEIEYIIHSLIDISETDLKKPGDESEQFQLSNDAYKSLIHGSSDLISIFDVHAKYIYTSPASYSVLGWKPEEFIGKSVAEFIHPDDRTEVLSNFSKLGIEKKIRISPFRFRHKNGTWRWLETTVTDFIDEPSVNGIVTNSRDITARIHAEEELKNSEGKYRLLFHSSPLPKYIFDLDTFEILDVNETASRHYGYSREEFLKMTIYDIRPPEEIPAITRINEEIQNCVDTTFFGIFIHHKKDGTKIKVEVSGQKLSFSGRGCMMVVCVDVTDRENALQSLRDNEAKLLAAEKIAKLGYWKLDIQEGNLFWSDEVYNIWGVAKDSHQITPGFFFNSVHPDDQQAFKKENEAILAGEKEGCIEHRIVMPDGSVKWVREKGKLIRNDAGDPVSFEGSVQDITEEKLLKLSLEESNRRFSYVNKATFDAIWDWNLVMDESYWGEGFQTIFGYDFKKIQTEKNFWTDHIHPDDFDKIYNGIRNAINGNDSKWVNEYRFQRADKSYANVLDRCIIIRDQSGKAIRMVGAIQDITEKKTLEVLLDKANRLARIGSWEIDVINGSVYWSDITKEIREVEPDFAPTLTIGMGNFVDGYSKDTIFQRVKDCIEKGTPWEDELQIITEKGNLKWIRTIGKAEMVNGKCVKVYGSFQDIDTTKKAEIKILKLYEEKNTILESIGDGFFALDKNWMVTYWNKEAEKILQRSKFEMMGKNIWTAFPDAVESRFYKYYEKAVAEKKAQHFEEYYERMNLWLDVSAFPSDSGLSVYFKNITERKISEKKLKELNEQLDKKAHKLAISNAELEQFAYVASHDLQEPLRMVSSFLTQLEKKYGDILDDKGRQYIYFAVDGAKRMRQIILDLLEFSRIGKLEGNMVEVNVNELIKEIILLSKNHIEETGAIINFDNLPSLSCTKTHLRQIFQNLISNAIKYHKENEPPVITISAEKRPGHWLFSVNDNGIGIEPVYFNRVFTIFQRLHGKDEYSGTGIGLAIVKKIVERMEGEIWIESEPAKGSTFFFTIKS